MLFIYNPSTSYVNNACRRYLDRAFRESLDDWKQHSFVGFIKGVLNIFSRAQWIIPAQKVAS